MLNNFGYLLDIAKRMYLKQSLNITKIKQLGSRKSGKTFSDIEFLGILLMLDNIKIHAYLIRNMSKQLNDSWQELKQIIKATYPTIDFIISETKKTIEFNGSKITCKYLHAQDNSNVKLTGLASNYLYDYVIIWTDERYEITENDYQDLKDAIRGANQLLEIESCNPWSILNEFIKKTVTACPQNEKQIINEYEQFTIIDNTIYHYQNWKLNTYLKDSDKYQLLEIEKLDPISARVRSHGLVGYESGGIYSHLIHKISRLLQSSYRFSAGLDYGFKDDAMECVLLGFDYDFKFVNVIDCLKIENKLVRYDNKQLAKLVVEFYINLAQKYNLLYEYGLTVYCDFSNYTFIEMLNDTAIKYKAHTWLYFKDCVKLRLEFRIGKNIALMATERLNISIQAQLLLDEFRLAIWDPKSIKQIPLAGNDHLRDAFDYAIEPYIRNLSANINPYFERK
ncbi:phage terminase large subunit [Spiroplasma endosymbiont of Nebria brevicollis]|uniref:phage terminase large subunit n=1 Tax=Spiroplasma endosymbiont of Nebria brevicollis TaxID=3066284 RepID=UPI00313E403D